MFSAWNAVSAMDRLFDDVMGSPVGAATTARTLDAPTDIIAGPEDVSFRCDVPGVRDEDLEVTIEDRVLTIRGARKYDAREGCKVILGRAYGAFTRTFRLPDTLDAGGLTAHLRDGVLTVRVPKLAKVPPRKIPVGSGAEVKDPKR